MELALRVPRITGDLDGHRKGYNTEKRDEKKRRLYGGQDRRVAGEGWSWRDGGAENGNQRTGTGRMREKGQRVQGG